MVNVNKKAQFYLIAAIIIVGVIVLLATVSNYIVTRKEPVKFYDLGEEFKEEGARVVDYGFYDATDPRSTAELIESLTDNLTIYSEEKDKGSELVFVYGNKSDITISTYSTIKTGEVSLIVGGTPHTIYGTGKLNRVKDTITTDVPDQVNVTLLGQEYEFYLHEGENFLFVLSKNITDTNEVYITKKE